MPLNHIRSIRSTFVLLIELCGVIAWYRELKQPTFCKILNNFWSSKDNAPEGLNAILNLVYLDILSNQYASCLRNFHKKVVYISLLMTPHLVRGSALEYKAEILAIMEVTEWLRYKVLTKVRLNILFDCFRHNVINETNNLWASLCN